MLTLVATPIGNLKDLTLRALETLEACDEIICEDTRRSGLLLQHYHINKPLNLLNDFNESKQLPLILAKLQQGMHLCIISDAGTPLISDPGYKLVRECKRLEIEVDSLPGPSAVLTALTLSALPPDKFIFLGYFPDKPSHRQKIYENLTLINNIQPATFIVFVAPFKLEKTLTEMHQSLGNISVCLAKELTKIHQSVKLKKISDWLAELKNKRFKGEFVMCFNLNVS